MKPSGKTATVYNIEVAGFHTYFVGESRTWVHNKVMRAIVSKIKNGPRFAKLKDHARRHGLRGQTANEYYNAAAAHTKSGTPFRFRHAGARKVRHVTRTGADSFARTSTTRSGNRVFTHIYDVSEQHLNNLGITLPGGF